MSDPQVPDAIDRLFTELDTERVDGHGFLDHGRTPGLLRFDRVLAQPLAWVLGPPWLGKSTVAAAIDDYLRCNPEALDGIKHRHYLTRLGAPGTDRDVPPAWWRGWCQEGTACPAVWLIDGVDEGLDRNEHLLNRILGAIDDAPASHRRRLRLILFSRPHPELGDFRQELHRRYAGNNRRAEPPVYWLTRLDRGSAEGLVGRERLPAILGLIERCNLKPVAGFPIVLRYLARYPETTGLSVPLVWRGILLALLGEQHTNVRARFDTSPEERFAAACRIAAVLTLTRMDTIREHSPDPGVPTVGTLFHTPENRHQTAAWEACRTAVLQHLPEQGAFRFPQRNAQDWFTAFALEGLPLPALRSALSGPNGALTDRLREPARLIRATTGRPEVRDEIDRLGGGVILPSDAAEPTLTEAVRFLDRLEQLAGESSWGLRPGLDWQDDLARLRVDGLEAILADRLRSPVRPHQVKEMLIDVAEATRALDAVEPALELIRDGGQHQGLRYKAMWFVARFGGSDHLLQLEGPIGEESTGNDEIDRRLRGVLVAELFDRGLWPVWRAALHAPPPDTGVLDHRPVLVSRLRDSMTADDAQRLLPHLRALCVRHRDEHQPHRLPDFISRVIDLLAGQQPAAPADLDALVGFALELLHEDLGWPMAREVAIRLREHPQARRRFYQHDIEVIRSGRDEQRLGAWSLLHPEDWRWLRDQALGPWADCREAWDGAHWMARRAHNDGQLSTDEWEQFVSLVDRHVPGLPAEIEVRIRRQEEERKREEAERAAREQRTGARPTLAEQLRQILDQQGLTAPDRMRRMGYLCTVGRWRVRGRGSVEEADLHEDLWRRVLEAFLHGLDVGEPAPRLGGGGISPLTCGEATAFSHVACTPGFVHRMTESMVRRWLPVALCAHVSNDWAEMIRACWAVSQPATEKALIEVAADAVRRSEQPLLVALIPSECWTEGLAQRIITLIRDDATNPRTRRELLERLAIRSPGDADGIAAEWAARAAAADETDQLRQGGRNVLLVRAPSTALDLIEPDFNARGAAVLEELPALWGRGNRLYSRWERWPAELLERLGRLLLRGFPPAEDPPLQSGFLTPDQELRQLRDVVISHLLAQPAPEFRKALERLAEMDLTVRAYVASHRASSEAARLLPAVNPGIARDPGALSVTEAVQLLDRAEYRLIRSTDDLLDAVLEALRQTQADAGSDLPMLYHAPDRKAGGKQPRKHLEEDALQAYLRRRLLGILPRIADEVDVQIFREDQVARRQRLDLRVTAPCHGSRRISTVVIEVKWSTNDETRTGLVTQLGERYLLGEGLTHGIFLVGWCGEWTPGDGTGVNTDMGTLVRYLARQRDNYHRRGERGESLRIEPFVLDLRWSLT